MSEPERAASSSRALKPAPRSLATDSGTPAFGLYAGSLSEAGFDALDLVRTLPALRRLFVEKRWLYALVVAPEAMIALAIADLGYLSSGFCAVFDRGARTLRCDLGAVLPPFCAEVDDTPGEGAAARLRGPFLQARIARSGGRGLVEARWGPAHIDLVLELRGGPPALTALAPCGPARFDLTQKTVLAKARGEVRVGGASIAIEDGLAGLDFTHGLLPRETAWRWAFGMGVHRGRAVAFNLSEGFLGGEGECAAWVDGVSLRVGPVRFSFDPQVPLAPWRVQSDDGDLDLRFAPEGVRAQSVNLSLVRSRYAQPFGTFAGHLPAPGGGRVEIDGIPGVTEDHDARW